MERTAQSNASLLELTNREYKAGFVTDIESESIPPVSRGRRPPDLGQEERAGWLLEWRLKAYRHWLTMKEPTWQNVHYPPIDYQSIVYYSAPKAKNDGPKSLEDVDPKLLETYEKLGIPLRERAKLAGVAVTRSSTRSPSPRRSANSSRKSASSSARSRRRSRTTRARQEVPRDPSSLTPTTSSRR
jgi:Fe-S cluster assembly scaffold protein SufB